MTSVEIFDSAAGTWNAITYSEYKIPHGTSDVQIAPAAEVKSVRGADPSAGQRLRIMRDDGTRLFEGDIVRTPRTQGRSGANLTLEAEHDAHPLFEENVFVSLTDAPTDEQVLLNALLGAELGDGFTLNYVGTATTLNNDYVVNDRSLKWVFRDMMDRTGRVWWVGVDKTIHVEPRGYRGLFGTLDTAAGDGRVRRYTPDDVGTVVNDVTVNGTGAENVTATASDQTSIDTYGAKSAERNLKYATTQSEASAYAQALLIPDPLASAEVLATDRIGDVTLPIVNYDLAVQDPDGTGMDATLTVQKQVVREGRSVLGLGEGAGVNKAQFNRTRKSDDDKTAPGAVMGSDRIGESSVDETKVDALDLNTNQLTIGTDADFQLTFAVRSTSAGNVTAIESTGPAILGTDANRFDSYLGAVNATGDITLDGDIPSVAPDADDKGTVGTSGRAWSEIHAYSYIDAGTGSAINDGGDPTAGVAEGRGPPDAAAVTDDDGEIRGYSINDMARQAWDIIRAQQRELESLRERVAALEGENA